MKDPHSCHAFLCMNSWALVTSVTSVQNIDIESSLAIILQLKLQTGKRRICPIKLGTEMSNLASSELYSTSLLNKNKKLL